MPTILRIDMQHPFYQKERELRNEVLLRPIGIPDYGWEMNDKKSWHFVAVENSELIGCVLLAPLTEGNKRAQLLQMAVKKSWQGKGIGKVLVASLLSFARSIDLKEIEIHSRAEVIPFYEQLGFERFGDPFEEVGIQHQMLSLKL